MKIDEMIEVLQAAKAGEQIQSRGKGQIDKKKWFDRKTIYINWNFESYEYRIKPQPREWWITQSKTGQHLFDYTPSNDWIEIIKVREVIE